MPWLGFHDWCTHCVGNARGGSYTPSYNVIWFVTLPRGKTLWYMQIPMETGEKHPNVYIWIIHHGQGIIWLILAVIAEVPPVVNETF